MPAFGGVEEEGGVFGDLVEAYDGELLRRGELGEVERFEFEVEVGRDLREFRRRAVRDELEAEGVGLPSFEGVAEDGDLACESLDGEEEKKEEAHGNE